MNHIFSQREQFSSLFTHHDHTTTVCSANKREWRSAGRTNLASCYIIQCGVPFNCLSPQDQHHSASIFAIFQIAILLAHNQSTSYQMALLHHRTPMPDAQLHKCKRKNARNLIKPNCTYPHSLNGAVCECATHQSRQHTPINI